MSQKAFDLKSLTLRYPFSGQKMGLWSFSLESGQSGALCGPSGCGKTTLLHWLAGLAQDGFGPLEVSGSRYVTSPVDLLFEKPFLQILGPSVKDELNAAEAGSWLPPESKKREKEWLLDAFLLDSLWNRPVRELSEGERQKVALACLFLRSPSLLLLDQPASCLDRGARDVLKAAIERATQRGAAALFADPDWREITPSKTDRFSLFPKASSLPKEVSEEGLFDGPPRKTTAQDEAILEFEGLEIRRGGRTVLRDVSGRVSRGEIIALVGDNGSGKTSLLLAIAGLVKPAKGRVKRHYQNGRPLRRTRPALMLQESLWHLSGKAVQGELAWACQKPGSQGGISKNLLASLLGLETLLERPGLLLSRGEMQRVALAMALLRNAPIVCLDEPLRFLWEQERKTIGSIFRTAQNRGITFLIASPVEDMLPWADQVWRLTRGRMETCRNASAYVKSATQSSLEHFGAP